VESRVIVTFPNTYVPREDTEAPLLVAFPVMLLSLTAAVILPGFVLNMVKLSGTKLGGFANVFLQCAPAQLLLFVPAFLVLLLPHGDAGVRERCGFGNWKWSYLKEVPLFFCVAVFPLMMTIVFVSVWVFGLLGVDIDSPVGTLLEGADLADLLFLYCMAVFVAPVAEEFAFRRVMFSFVRRHAGVLPALFVASGFFAMIHWSPIQALPVFTLGMASQLLYLRHNSIIPGVMLHFLNNLVVMTPVLVVKLISLELL